MRGGFTVMGLRIKQVYFVLHGSPKTLFIFRTFLFSCTYLNSHKKFWDRKSELTLFSDNIPPSVNNVGKYSHNSLPLTVVRHSRSVTVTGEAEPLLIPRDCTRHRHISIADLNQPNLLIKCKFNHP